MRILLSHAALLDKCPESRVVEIVDVAVALPPGEVVLDVTQARVKDDARVEGGHTLQRAMGK